MSSTKRKLLISMLIISFVLLSVAATIAIIFALTQQNISTSLNINYTAVDIDGTVTANYKLGKNNTYGTATPLEAYKNNQKAEDNILRFYADDTEENNNGRLEFPINDITFTSQQSSMLIEYTFTNNGDVHYIASLSLTEQPEYENMIVEYGVWDEENQEIKFSTDIYAVVVPANSSSQYWIRISIDKLTSNASLTGNFDWLLDGCDEKEKSYLSITSVEIIGSNGSYKISFSGEGDYIAGEEVIFPDKIAGIPVTSIINNSSTTTTQKALVKSVFIPASVTSIGYQAFHSFSELEEVIFEQNILEESGNFSGTGLSTINSQAFYNCIKLNIFEIPSTVKTIGASAFQYCQSLTYIVIPNGVTTLEQSVFWDCRKLKEVEILGDVTLITWYAFCACYNLEKINIPASVTKINAHAFNSCNLKHVEFENPNGWDIDGTAVDPEILSDPTTAAAKLKSYSKNNYWTRTEVTTEVE